ncbi:MAG: hypothetical protein IJ935_20220 [Afipia sp.]|jgi:hypothetical protein|nr:hypothetical protein [Afipia sp.]
MQTPIGQFTQSGLGSRRNWTLCWRWSVSILAVEFALVMALIGFAVSSRPASPVKSSSQVEQAQPNPAHNRRACPLVNVQKTRSL